jgi:hypothetical protein
LEFETCTKSIAASEPEDAADCSVKWEFVELIHAVILSTTGEGKDSGGVGQRRTHPA